MIFVWSLRHIYTPRPFVNLEALWSLNWPKIVNVIHIVYLLNDRSLRNKCRLFLISALLLVLWVGQEFWYKFRFHQFCSSSGLSWRYVSAGWLRTIIINVIINAHAAHISIRFRRWQIPNRLRINHNILRDSGRLDAFRVISYLFLGFYRIKNYSRALQRLQIFEWFFIFYRPHLVTLNFKLRSCFKRVFDGHHAWTRVLIKYDFGHFDRLHHFFFPFKTEIQRSFHEILVYRFLRNWFLRNLPRLFDRLKKWKFVNLRTVYWIFRRNFLIAWTVYRIFVCVRATVILLHLDCWKLPRFAISACRLF